MNTNELEKLLKKIKCDDYFLEATLQFKLLMKLAEIRKEDNIFPERNIEYYKLESKKYTKKEVDIVLENENNTNVAIELKMPMNGQTPEQMYKFVEDIKFLEELKKSNVFSSCFLITVTNDKNFWQGREKKGIYSYFRDNRELSGKITKPTGKIKTSHFLLQGKYNVTWKNLNDDFKYFIIEI